MQYCRWGIIREPRREYHKAGHYPTIILPSPFVLFCCITISRFTVNFVEDSDDYKAFHFDVRNNVVGDIKQVIRNAKTAGSFGDEERSIPYFPFEPGKDLDLIFLCLQDRFKV